MTLSLVYGHPQASPSRSFGGAWCGFRTGLLPAVPLWCPERDDRSSRGTEILTNSNKMREINPDVITLGQAFRKTDIFLGGKIYHYGNPSMIGTD